MKRKPVRAKKNLIVVAYDIADDKRRNRIVKLLLKFGNRVNYSVFECMLSDADLEMLKIEIRNSISVRHDIVLYYPICVKCYSKVFYQRPSKEKHETVNLV